ncbi:MAG TPA: hypothetical protein VGE39_23370 [Prosthecobacter sp.]
MTILENPPLDVPPKPAEDLADRFMDEAEHVVRTDPAKAVAVAVGAGLLLNVLPTRFLVASATAVTLTMLRPALLTLGVIKAFELCSAKHHRS